jgi:hypothetical protein
MPQTLTEYDTKLPAPGAHPTAPKRPNPCADDKPVCPACGGLQCLCRPRFFPGQLLTDEDLNRLERYIIEKNRLHARYLHGWGVACGLEVACDPCSTSNVVVRTGYALSPCGDDIIVCKDHSVNVCELIDQCRPQTEVVCDPPYTRPPRECRDGVEKWVLAICYDERPTRGITALTGSTDSACCSPCACGGSGSCGCKTGSTSASTSKAKKPYKPQCEPTQICEGYRFKAYRLPKETKVQLPDRITAGNKDLLFAWMYANRAKFGPMIERLLCCVTAALELRESFGQGKYPTGREAADAYRDYLEALRGFATDFALHHCAFVDKLVADTQATRVEIEGLRNVKELTEAHRTLFVTGMRQLDRSLFDLIAECFCSALLPACPEPAPDNCVPLAVLTVRTRDCHVVDICNWEARKLLISWRTIGYWLSWLPWQRLRGWIVKLCCAEGREQSIFWLLVVAVGISLSGARSSTGTKVKYEIPRGTATPSSAGQETNVEFADTAYKQALDAESLMSELTARFDRLRTGEEPAAPGWIQMLTQAATGDIGGLAALRAQVSELQATVAEMKRAAR